jgi:hypothetical protein
VEEKNTVSLQNESTVVQNLTNVNYATLEVNALHLAILAKQADAVKCILECILSDQSLEEKNKADTIIFMLCDIVILKEPYKLFGTMFRGSDYSLDQMNAYHLSCQFYPDAIEILYDVLCNHEGEISGIAFLDYFKDNIQTKLALKAKNNVMNYTPLHIAAQNGKTGKFRECTRL